MFKNHLEIGGFSFSENLSLLKFFNMYFSIIIPVYNRPDEIKELLESLVLLDYNNEFEIVIVEDGSSINCKSIVDFFIDKLSISYYFKENSGPGDSRNYGMNLAKGDYFIIFDSDCIIPKHYLSEVEKELNPNLKNNKNYEGISASLVVLKKLAKGEFNHKQYDKEEESPCGGLTCL